MIQRLFLASSVNQVSFLRGSVNWLQPRLGVKDLAIASVTVDWRGVVLAKTYIYIYPTAILRFQFDTLTY